MKRAPSKQIFLVFASGILLSSCGFHLPNYQDGISLASNNPVSSVPPTSTSTGKGSQSDTVTHFTFAYNESNQSYTLVSAIDNFASSKGVALIPESFNDGTHGNLLVRSIKEGVFASFKTLQSVFIPSGINEIGAGAFLNCPSLSSFSVDPANSAFYSDGSSIWTMNLSALIATVTQMRSTTYYLPSGLSSISSDCFVGASFSEVILPDSVRKIGDRCFTHCSFLSGITLPTSLSVLGEDCFQDCPKLAQFTFQGNSSFYSDGKALFRSYQSCLLYFAPASSTSYAVPSNILSIGPSAFLGNTLLKDITFPAGLESVGQAAFSDCSNLDKVTFLSNSVTLDNSCFLNTSSLQTVTFPTGGGPSVVGESAFANSGIENSDFLSSTNLTTINENAFFGCTRLKTVSLGPNLQSIVGNPFAACSALSHFDFPSGNNFSFRSDGAFLYQGTAASGNYTLIAALLSSPSSLSIAAPITRIGPSCFRYSQCLEGLFMPASLLSIGEFALADCAVLTSLNYTGTSSGFSSIIKEANWHQNSPQITSVACSDGSVPL